MESRLRYIIGVGLQYVSDRVDAPNSTGKPPACHTPRLTCSARSRRCIWHGFSSDQVLMIAMIGLPACPASSTPICRIRDLWLNERRLFEPNHPALRKVSGVLVIVGLSGSSRARRGGQAGLRQASRAGRAAWSK